MDAADYRPSRGADKVDRDSGAELVPGFQWRADLPIQYHRTPEDADGNVSRAPQRHLCEPSEDATNCVFSPCSPCSASRASLRRTASTLSWFLSPTCSPGPANRRT